MEIGAQFPDALALRTGRRKHRLRETPVELQGVRQGIGIARHRIKRRSSEQFRRQPPAGLVHASLPLDEPLYPLEYNGLGRTLTSAGWVAWPTFNLRANCTFACASGEPSHIYKYNCRPMEECVPEYRKTPEALAALNPEKYRVIQHSGTERSGTGA